MSNNSIKTTDITTKSLGAQTKAKKKGAIVPEQSPKDRLRDIKSERKDLNAQLKALTKEENKLKKASNTKKKTNKK